MMDHEKHNGSKIRLVWKEGHDKLVDDAISKETAPGYYYKFRGIPFSVRRIDRAYADCWTYVCWWCDEEIKGNKVLMLPNTTTPLCSPFCVYCVGEGFFGEDR